MKNLKSISPSSGTLLVLLAFFLHSSNAQFFKTPCRDHYQCASNQFLQCLNGFCQCDSRSQIYDYKLNQCSTLAGKKCDANNGFGPKCSRNSACILSNCECQPGYSLTSEFICKPNFQHKCKISQDCDGDNGLTCIDGSCQCQNAALTYQGLFGCVDPTNPNFIEMMTTLKRTENLLFENRIDIDKMLGELESSESQSYPVVKSINDPSGLIQPRQLFEDSYSNTNTNTDLLGSAQNSQNSLGGLLNVFRGLGNSLGGLGGLSQLLGNLGGGGRRPAQGGYPASGVPQNQQPQAGIFSIFTSFLNLFNQILPAIRQFKMLLNPLKFIQRLLKSLRIPSLNTGGYGAPKPLGSVYGPPKSQTPAYGPPSLQPAVTGGYNNGPVSSPGPAPQTQASQPQAQSIDQPYTTLPIQPLQPSFQNFQPQSIQDLNFQLNPIQQQSSFDNTASQFQNQNQQRFQNQNNQNSQQQGFAQQNQQFQNIPQSQNFQNPSPIDNTRPLTPLVQPLQPQESRQVSNNKYPRQERFSYSNPNDDDSSPYLPEHL